LPVATQFEQANLSPTSRLSELRFSINPPRLLVGTWLGTSLLLYWPQTTIDRDAEPIAVRLVSASMRAKR